MKRNSLAKIVEEEGAHARALDTLLGVLSLSPPLPAVPSSGNGAAASGAPRPWAAALVVAFSLDQAATACLTALQGARITELAVVAKAIVADEARHQRFILDTLYQLVAENPAFGTGLAAEVAVAHDWTQDVFPRRAELALLVENGQLRSDGVDAHDSFLANLSQRMQRTLGLSV